ASFGLVESQCICIPTGGNTEIGCYVDQVSRNLRRSAGVAVEGPDSHIARGRNDDATFEAVPGNPLRRMAPIAVNSLEYRRKVRVRYVERGLKRPWRAFGQPPIIIGQETTRPCAVLYPANPGRRPSGRITPRTRWRCGKLPPAKQPSR